MFSATKLASAAFNSAASAIHGFLTIFDTSITQIYDVVHNPATNSIVVAGVDTMVSETIYGNTIMRMSANGQSVIFSTYWSDPAGRTVSTEVFDKTTKTGSSVRFPMSFGGELAFAGYGVASAAIGNGALENSVSYKADSSVEGRYARGFTSYGTTRIVVSGQDGLLGGFLDVSGTNTWNKKFTSEFVTGHAYDSVNDRIVVISSDGSMVILSSRSPVTGAAVFVKQFASGGGWYHTPYSVACIAGYTYVTHGVGTGSGDIYLLVSKFDAAGNEIWTLFIEPPVDEKFYIAKMALASYISDSGVCLAVGCYPNSNTPSWKIMKIDSAGVVLWQSSLQRSESGLYDSIQVCGIDASSDLIYVCGIFQYADEIQTRGYVCGFPTDGSGFGTYELDSSVPVRTFRYSSGSLSTSFFDNTSTFFEAGIDTLVAGTTPSAVSISLSSAATVKNRKYIALTAP